MNNGKAAGQVLEKAAACEEQVPSIITRAPETLLDAAKAYRDTAPEEAARVLRQASYMLAVKGFFHTAGDVQLDLAELYETKIGDSKKAIEAYQKARELYCEKNGSYSALSEVMCVLL